MSRIVVIRDDGTQKDAMGGIFTVAFIAFAFGMGAGAIVGSWLTLMF
jgi:hypothetical protein